MNEPSGVDKEPLVSSEAVERILGLIRQVFPDWAGFSDKRFEKEEVDYKQEAVRLAGELLSETELRRLVDEGRAEEVVDRLDRVGKHNNLLYRARPRQGDLGILYHEELNKPEFARAVLDLLHGDGPSPVRLERYADWVDRSHLPNKWTFPTYFLFLCHPASEMFVKPVTTTSLFSLIGSDATFRGRPTAHQYSHVLDITQELLRALHRFGPRDMVDIQGLIWRATQEAAAPGEHDEEETQGDDDKSTPRSVSVPPAVTAGWFTRRTFELLEGLHRTPKRDYYIAHKAEFQQYVEQPFKDFFARVVSALPQPVVDRMETEKNVFARIPKNDYGRGGAWGFYWGALYPQDGKRIEDAQLYILLDHECLRYGFSIGRYGDERRDTFLRGLNQHLRDVRDSVEENLPGVELLFGRWDLTEEPRPTSWTQWSERLDEVGAQAFRMLPAKQVPTQDKEELAEEIARTFVALFPLVLLAGGEHFHDEADELGESLAPEYTLESCSKDTFIPIEQLRRWIRTIERKKQAIFYGPPGTGKTFIAQHLTRHLIGGGAGFTDLIQFHPAYSYEDFIQGIRPLTSAAGALTYEMVQGRFLDFCRKAAAVEDTCVLIVDEINRANLSRVFGELMYLLEYRDAQIPLAGGRSFRVPPNVYLIGTMNTADRSIALVDHALRRRFAFLHLRPMYDTLQRFHEGKSYPVASLIEVLREINNQIGDPHYEIGVSFFLRDDLAQQVEDVWRTEIEPYLEEYFFDQQDKVEGFRWESVHARLKT